MFGDDGKDFPALSTRYLFSAGNISNDSCLPHDIQGGPKKSKPQRFVHIFVKY